MGSLADILIKNVLDYRVTKRFTAEALIKTKNVANSGRSILPEDAEGWLLGPGTGTGPGAVNEKTQSLTHVTPDTEFYPPKPCILNMQTFKLSYKLT